METVALVRTPDSHILKNSIIDKALYIVIDKKKLFRIISLRLHFG